MNLKKNYQVHRISIDINKNSKLVAVEQVKLQPFTHYIEVQGSLDGDNNIAVYPEAMGVVQEIYGKGRTGGYQKARNLQDWMMERLEIRLKGWNQVWN